MGLEQIPARHAHHAGLDAFGGELVGRFEADRHLAPGADQDAGGLPAGGLLEHVGAAGRARRRSQAGRTVEGRQILPGEHDHRGTVGPLHDHAVGFGHLVGVGRAKHRQAGHRAGGGELLDRLVGRAVFAEADGVVREHVDHAQVPECREPQRRLEVVEEHEEGGAVGPQARQRHAVAGRGHPVLADPEVEVAAGVAVVAEVARSRHERHRRGGEVGRAAQEPGHRAAERLDHLAARHPAGHALGVGGKAGDGLVPAGRQAAGEELGQFGGAGGVGRAEARHRLLPGGVGRSAAGPECGREVGGHLGRHAERLVHRPAVGCLRALDLLGAQGRPVRFVGARLLRGAVADHALHDHERGLVLLRLEGLQRLLQRGGVVGVGHPLHPPAEPLELLPHVLGEGEVRLALDRDLVVVVEPAEIREAEMAGDRGRLGGHALHQVAVAAEHVGVVVEHGVAGAVVVGGEPLGGDRHADGVAAALAEGAGGRLDAGGHVMLGMARADAVELAKLLDLVEGHGRRSARPADAGEMDQRIEEHRRMAAGEHEPVAVGPGGIGRVIAEEVLPDREGDRSQGHRRAWMAALGGLDGVHREGADRVDGEAVEGRGHGDSLQDGGRPRGV